MSCRKPKSTSVDLGDCIFYCNDRMEEMMKFANELIHFIYDWGWSETVYYGIVVAAFFMQLVFLLWYGKKYQISKRETVITLVIVYPSAYFLVVLLTWIENGFTGWGSNNIVRLFIYVPLIALFVAKLLKKKALL